MDGHNYYLVIPAYVLFDKRLSDKQKLLIGLISNLSNIKGYCFASNKYLGECLSCSENTIREHLSELETLQYIGRVIKLNDKGQVEFRSITVVTPPLENKGTPPQKSAHPSPQNPAHNNKEDNNKEEYRNDELKNSSNLYVDMVDYWLKLFHPGWTFNGVQGKAVKSLICKIKKILKDAGRDFSDQDILDFFKTMCQLLPEWYKEKDLMVIDSKFNEVISEIKNIKNGKSLTNKQPQSKYAPTA